MSTSHEAIDRCRDEFPTLGGGIYLLSHSLGPVPRSVRHDMLAYVRRWQEHTETNAWDAEWWRLSGDVGDAFGRLVGAAPGSVQVLPNASIAMSVVASCFDFAGKERRKVVTGALDFPSMGYVWQAQRRLGAEVHVVPSDDDLTLSTSRIREAIDGRTALVALSHVSYRSSYRADVASIVERAHQVGAKVLIDAYQSAGVCEIDAAGWNVDFLIGGSIKWLCGGPACGFLYVRPDLIQELEPRLTGWFAHADPFEFGGGAIRYDTTIRRFANGTVSVPALYSVRSGLRIIEAVGVGVIAAESRRRTQHIVDYGVSHGWTLHSPHDVARRGGTVMIEVEDGPSSVAKLAERKVFVDCRPGVGLRVSPHFFNSDDELDEAVRIISSVVK